MNTVCLVAATLMLLTILLGLGLVFRRPGHADCVLAALLFGTTGVALVLVLGKALDLSGTLDIALVLALLAVIFCVAFGLRGWPTHGPGKDGAS